MSKEVDIKNKLLKLDTVLKYSIDRFRGVKIDLSDQFDSKEDFKVEISKFITNVTENEGRAIWLKIPIKKSSFIQIAADEGFSFHHTSNDELTMTKWLDLKSKK